MLRTVVRRPLETGAMVPSSSALAQAMVRDLFPLPGRAVVELGPGTGPFTDKLWDTMDDPDLYVGIERERAFVDLLRHRYPALRLVHGSAEDVIDHLTAVDTPPVGTIVSGLPVATLPEPTREAILSSVQRLMGPGTTFRMFQYLHAWPLPGALRFRRAMTSRYGPPATIRPVLRNLPPAAVLSWRRSARCH